VRLLGYVFQSQSGTNRTQSVPVIDAGEKESQKCKDLPINRQAALDLHVQLYVVSTVEKASN